MAENTQITWRENDADPIQNIRNTFQYKLIEAKVVDAVYKNNIVFESTMRITVQIARHVVKNFKIVAKLIKEKEPFEPSEDGEWGINPLSVWARAEEDGYKTDN